MLDSINLLSEYYQPPVKSLFANLFSLLLSSFSLTLILHPFYLFSLTLFDVTAQNLAICLNASLNEKITGIFNLLPFFTIYLYAWGMCCTHPTLKSFKKYFIVLNLIYRIFFNFSLLIFFFFRFVLNSFCYDVFFQFNLDIHKCRRECYYLILDVVNFWNNIIEKKKNVYIFICNETHGDGRWIYLISRLGQLHTTSYNFIQRLLPPSRIKLKSHCNQLYSHCLNSYQSHWLKCINIFVKTKSIYFYNIIWCNNFFNL